MIRTDEKEAYLSSFSQLDVVLHDEYPGTLCHPRLNFTSFVDVQPQVDRDNISIHVGAYGVLLALRVSQYVSWSAQLTSPLETLSINEKRSKRDRQGGGGMRNSVKFI